MQPAGDVLARLTAAITARNSRPLSEKRVQTKDECPLPTPRPSDCFVCEDFNQNAGDRRIRYLTADCRAGQRRQLMLAKSGLHGKDIFETFAAAVLDKHNWRLYEYLQTEWDRRQWLYIFSRGNGTGKSFTGNAIANMLIAEGIQPTVIREVDMAAQLQATFSDDTGDTEYALMGRFKAVPVLIVQDFFKQSSRSEWWPQKIYDIIDHRVITGRPIVFTSNFDITNRAAIEKRFGENYGAAIHSRLMGAAEIWQLSGPDRRFSGDRTGTKAN